MFKRLQILSDSSDDSDSIVEAPLVVAQQAMVGTSDTSAASTVADEHFGKLTDAITTLVQQIGNAARPRDSRKDLIPFYDPEKPELKITQWIDKIEQLVQVYHWEDEMTAFYAVRRLKGLAAKWVETLPDVQCSWITLKEKLKRAFPTKENYCQLLKDMLARRKTGDETMLQYYFSKLSLLQQCHIDGEDAVSCIIDGLDDEMLKRTTEAAGHRTTDELLAFLKNCHQNRRESKHSNNRTAGKVKICYRCKQVGHKARDCPTQVPHFKLNKDESAERESVRCFLCKQTGHKAVNCRFAGRVFCNFCRRAGHEEKNCHRKRVAVGKEADTKKVT